MGTADPSFSIPEAFSHLNPEDQQRLPALSLFEFGVDSWSLAGMSQQDEVPDRFADWDEDDWQAALERCEKLGLVCKTLVRELFQLHPDLGPFLSSLWREHAADAFDSEFEKLQSAVLLAQADRGRQLLVEFEADDIALPLQVVDMMRVNMGRYLELALSRKLFCEALFIHQPLEKYFDVFGPEDQAQAFALLCIQAVEGPDGELPAFDSDAGKLWLSVTSAQADSALGSGQLDQAHSHYDKMRRALEPLQLASVQGPLALAYRGLAQIAQKRGELLPAEDWCQKAIRVEAHRGNLRGLAISYERLGSIVTSQGELRTAEAWYEKALELQIKINDVDSILNSYMGIGNVVFNDGRLEKAKDWYAKALRFSESRGDQYHMAVACHSLGCVALAQRDPKEADRCLQRALKLAEQAEREDEQALIYGDLAALEYARNNDVAALEWSIRALASQRLPDDDVQHLLRSVKLIAESLGMDALESTWAQVTGEPLPSSIRDAVLLASQEPGGGLH